MDTTKIKPEAREKIRAVCDLYDHGRNDLLKLLRAHDLGKRGAELTLGLVLESIDDELKSLQTFKMELKGEQAMGRLKKMWGMK